jgi:single-stranded DNA-binding protein
MFLGRLVEDSRVIDVNNYIILKFKLENEIKFRDGRSRKTIVDCFKFIDRAETANKLCSYLVKNKPIMVIGQYQLDSYLNKEGKTVTEPRFNIRDITFLPRDLSESNIENNQKSKEVIDDDDIPF